MNKIIEEPEKWYLIGKKDNSSFPQYWCKKDSIGYWKINTYPNVYIYDTYPEMQIYKTITALKESV